MAERIEVRDKDGNLVERHGIGWYVDTFGRKAWAGLEDGDRVYSIQPVFEASGTNHRELLRGG